jgi:hypothetical protein
MTDTAHDRRVPQLISRGRSAGLDQRRLGTPRPGKDNAVTRGRAPRRILSLPLHVQFGRTCTGGSAEVDRPRRCLLPSSTVRPTLHPVQLMLVRDVKPALSAEALAGAWATPRVPPACP